MDRAEKFGVYGVQQRAKRYDSVRGRIEIPDDTDEAIPIRRRAKQAEQAAPPHKRSAVQDSAESGSYRVRDAAYRAQARARAARGDAAHFTGDTAARDRRRTRTAPQDRRRSRADPDIAHNSDAIFEDPARRAAYRMAQKRRAQHRASRSAVIALCLVMFIAFASLLVYKLFFVAQNFTVEGNVRYTAEEIVAASSVSAGDNLYSFSAVKTADTLTFHLPYIQTLSVRRTVPDSVCFTVQEETAVFWAELYGQTWALSGSLRLLEPLDAAEARESGLIRLRLPDVESAVSGRVITFKDERSSRRIREIVEAVLNAELCDRLTSVDLRNSRALTMVSDDCYLLDLGDGSDAALKLRVAYAVLQDSLFDTTVKAEIDLTMSGSTSVVFDGQLDLDA